MSRGMSRKSLTARDSTSFRGGAAPPGRTGIPRRGGAPQRYLWESVGKAADGGEELARSPLLLQDEIAQPLPAKPQCLGERDLALGLEGLLQQHVTFVETSL